MRLGKKQRRREAGERRRSDMFPGKCLTLALDTARVKSCELCPLLCSKGYANWYLHTGKKNRHGIKRYKEIRGKESQDQNIGALFHSPSSAT
jgi:hypothetical protein